MEPSRELIEDKNQWKVNISGQVRPEIINSGKIKSGENKNTQMK